MNKGKILLHTCCGPCATASVERLLGEGWSVDMFFSNSNINSLDEYRLRLDAAADVAAHFGVKLIDDGYNHSAWLDSVRGYESEPEKGGRCAICFGYSFRRTAAAVSGYDGFTSTLSISPHKNSAVIFKTGTEAGPFIEYDFKKKNGFGRSIELSKQLGLYRQAYCGCEFSIR